MSIIQRKFLFKKTIRGFYRNNGRKLPWRRTRNPYYIFVSEIMLQQTQVERVEKFYSPFLRRFPDLRALAKAPLADILQRWQGLGYNRRALYLKRAAAEIVTRHGSAVPRDQSVLAQLPGIGTSTAGAIAAFAFNTPVPFIETNIRRVYLHFFFPRRRAVPDAALLSLIAQTLNRKNPREWYYALMDYGAMLGAARKGAKNPNRRSKHYTRQSKFAGSDREIRGRIIALALKEKHLDETALSAKLHTDTKRIKNIVAALLCEGLIKKESRGLTIAS